MEIDENGEQEVPSTHERQQSYRNILNRIEDINESEDTSLSTVKELKSIFKELKVLYEAVPNTERCTRTEEYVLDTTALSNASDILYKCIENVNYKEATYDPVELSTNILTSLEESPNNAQNSNLLKLYYISRGIITDIPEYSSFFCAFEPNTVIEPKVRQQRAKRSVEHVVKKQLKRSANVVSEQEGIEDTLSILISVLQEEYKDNEKNPIGYLEYIMDNSSFETTVENMFYFAFLIRDGRANILLDESNQLLIKPMKKSLGKKFHEEGGHNFQMIPLITMEQWKKFCTRKGHLQKYRERQSK